MSSDAGTPSRTSSRAGRRSPLRRLIGLLPAPRGAALLEIARGVRDLALGREPRSVQEARRADLAEERRRMEQARALLAQGDPTGALAEIGEIERLRPGSPGAAALRSSASRSAPIRGRGRQRPPIEGEIDAALDHVRRLGHDRPTLLLYHQASPDNPFQALFYRRAWERGVAPVPLWDLDDLDRIAAGIPADTRPVLHLHWVNKVLHGAGSHEEAVARVAAFAARLDRAIAAGFRIVWTAHNVLPHDTPMKAEDTELRRVIVERADMVHVLAASTPDLAAPYYDIPLDKVVHVPLPSFRGAYADSVDRAGARFALGLAADAYVIALVGGLRAHKGLDTLLDALDLAAATEPRLLLLVAGSPNRDDAVETFLARAANHPRVSLHARPIPADDMQLFLRAADVAILPYLRTLNSAVLMMVLGFDLPVIAPPVGGIGETIEPDVAVTFEPGDVRSLATAMLAARDLAPESVRAAARRISEAHDADVISDRFMSALLAAITPSPLTTG